MEKEIDILRRQVKDLQDEILSLKQKQHSSMQDSRSHIAHEQATLDLQEEMKFRETFIQSLPGFFVVINSKGKTTLINDSMLQALGYTRDEVVGKDYLTTLVPESEREKVSRVFQELIHKNEATISENHIIAKNGKELLMEWQGRYVVHENGKADCFYGVGTNITERSRSEEALRTLSARQEAILAAVPEIIVEVDCNKVYTWSNQTGVEFFGEDVIGKDASFYFEGEQDTYRTVQPLFNGDDQVFYVESWQRRRDGQKRLLAWWCRILKDSQGTITGALSTARDITDLRQAEEALRKSERFLRSTLDGLSDSIALLDEQGKILLVNKAWREFAEKNGISSVSAVSEGSNYLQICDSAYGESSEEAGPFAEGIRDVLSGVKESYVLEYPCHSPDKKRWFVGRITPFPDDGPRRVVVAHRDITERKRAVEALRDSEERHRKIVEASTDAIILRSEKGSVIYANPAALKLFRANHPGDLIGKQYLDLVHPDDRALSAERVRKTIEENWITSYREHRILALDGQVMHVESIGGIVKHRGESQMFGVFRDITERKLADEKLRETEKKYRELAEFLPQAIFEVDSNGNLIYLNHTGHELFGYTPEDLAKGFNVLEAFIPEDRERVAHDINLNIQGQRLGRQDYTALRKDGTKFPAGVHAGRVMSGQTATGVRGILIDLTETQRADAEKKKLETQLRQAQKMEAIGSLAGGIAHDFNNILSVIIGYAELLEMSDVSSDVKDGLHQVFAASQRAKQLVRQILAFSRQGEQQKLLMSLKPVVRETLDFLRASIPSTIHLQHYIKPDAGAVVADSTQMQQVLMNLCTNAAHAMEKEGGVLKIALDTKTIAEEDVRLDPEVERGEYVRLTVSDTGHGIPLELLQRIFDPYFTTKGPDKGTGLGLSVVHGIVKSYGGIIRVESEVGKGTIFHVLLPRADEAPKKEEKAVRLLPAGTERILVVDDEKPLADIYQQMLGKLGYKVEIRTSPVEALEAVRMNPQKYDLVITDMTMPQMTGYNLSKKLMEIRPGLPVILCTGFSDQINEEKARSVGILAFLLKPVPLHDLANTMRKVLDETHREKRS